MNSFIDIDDRFSAIPIDVVAMLAAVAQSRGREDLYRAQAPQVLERLAARTRFDSITASSAIEDIVLDDERALQVIRGTAAGPYSDRSEEEFAGYRVIEDPDPANPEAPRASAQQDPWHYSIARMVDACTSAGILPFYGPFGDIKDVEGCEAQFRAAFLMGCVGAWSLHPVQIEIAKKVFSPDPDEVAFAKKVLEAIPDGRGVHMIDGKMQDDATWKQCRVMVDLAEMLARKDPQLAQAYELEPAGA